MPEQGEKYLSFLRQAGCEPKVIAHCQAVRDMALSITDQINAQGVHPVNRELVIAGSVLHDIGRSRTHGMDHADVGERICQEIGLPEAVCRIVARHIGAGLTAQEREKFGLAPFDMIPETREEKIVAHADNLIKGTHPLSHEEFLNSICRHPEEIQARFISLDKEIRKMTGEKL